MSASPPNKLHVAAVVAFYMTAALVMVFVNKAVLVSAPSLPVSFLLAQLMLAVLFLHLSALISPSIASAIPSPTQVPRLTRELWRSLFWVVTVNAIGLLFNTLCLRDVDASFFQIARGLVLPLTIIVSAVVIRTKPSIGVIVSAAVVTFGFLLGVAPSLSPSSLGDFDLQLSQLSSLKSKIYASPLSLFYGVLSSLFIALHAVFIKSSLPAVDNSALALAWWSNAAGVLILFPIALISGEFGTMINMATSGEFASTNGLTFLVGSFVTGFVGFLLCIAALLSVKVTSPITHMFSSAARSVLQTVLGVWIFHDILTVNRALSILVILFGTLFYTWIKSKESKPPISRASDTESGPSVPLKVAAEGKEANS